MSEQHSSTHTLELKFASEHIDPILRGEKTATIRLPDGDEKWGRYQIGHRLRMCNEDGERFASADISDRGYNDAESIVVYGVDGHRDYPNVDTFIEAMYEYYPDAIIDPDTCFEIIYWEDVQE